MLTTQPGGNLKVLWNLQPTPWILSIVNLYGLRVNCLTFND
ncbi:hypothetical protein MC7420_841 [Coleofasciculus chthonoplastes PCC 7420]|uniref:Uncharacterized protein n=1 Tax=Coleofasciculus chthonoplastes PCC 7420 TaxID=118168 RepID=B4VT84_9CYAN|nr:hypothetical protein MC7420_841 [Coleofasciculus chthonoplastes PCC 7420]